MTLWGTVTELQKIPTLGTEPVELQVEPLEAPERTAALSECVRALYQKCQFYDVVLSCGGRRFPAHQAVLAAMSQGFRDRLREVREQAAKSSTEAAPQAAEPASAAAPQEGDAAPGASAAAEVSAAGGSSAAAGAGADPSPAAAAAPAASPTLATPSATASAPKDSASRYPELELHGINDPEAVRALLDFVYGLGGEYSAPSDEANRDVLRLAQQFSLPQLEEHATRKLISDLTTSNVVARLATCDEFQLKEVYDLIIDECVDNTTALLQISNDMEVMKHPTILQSLLVHAAKGHAEGDRGRKGAASETSFASPSKRAGGAAEVPGAKRTKFGTRGEVSASAEVGGA